jgi:hypothetical protein
MADPQEDLRSTAESIRRDADRVKTLEDEKTTMDPTDPRVGDLSEQVERLSEGLHAKAVAERDLSDQIRGAG